MDSHRVASCGRVGVLPDGAVRVRATGSGADRRAGFAGLATCGSVWACPVCASKVLGARQDELARALAEWTSRGGRIALVTLTMRHRRGQRLSDLWDSLSHAWGKVTSGRRWEALQAAYGTPITRTVTRGRRRGELVTEPRLGWARVVEATHGRNGWHVHVHAVVFLPGTVTVDQAEDLGGAMYATWEKALRARGLSASREHGVDVKLWGSGQRDSSALADYFVKSQYDSDVTAAALELARGDLKTARGGNRSPFRILSDVVAFGLADDLDLWAEWEKASKGRRQLTWATGFRALLLDDVELSDEDLAAEELGSELDDVVELPASTWRTVAALGLDSILLDVAEDDDSGGQLVAYLRARGLPYTDLRSPARVM